MSRGDEWSDERVERLRALWAAKPQMSCAQIGLAIGISRSAVIGKAHRLKLPKRESGRQPGQQQRKPRARVSGRSEESVLHNILRARPSVPDLPPDQSDCAVRLLNAKFGQCRYPLSGAGPDLLFCGAPSIEGISWCPRHARVVFVCAGQERLPATAAPLRAISAPQRRADQSPG